MLDLDRAFACARVGVRVIALASVRENRLKPA